MAFFIFKHIVLRSQYLQINFGVITQFRTLKLYNTSQSCKEYRPLLVKSDQFRNFGLNHNSHVCWKCGARGGGDYLFCQKCMSIQKPHSNLTFFEILGVKHTYHLENATLTYNYRKLLNVLHPDRFSNKSEEERIISEEYSALINTAYTTLSQPLSRGLYMLKLEGIFIEEGNIQSSHEFLMEIMGKNEELAEVKNADDVKKIDIANKLTLESLSKNVEEAFSNGNNKNAHAALIKMKYYSSLDEKIKELKQDMGIVQE